MYDWLADAIPDDTACVVTVNRRLARNLESHYASRMIASGAAAWRRPPIHAFSDWLQVLVEGLRPSEAFPVRISAAQSRVLWEECLRTDLDDPLVSISGLARLCRDAWKRLHEWRVPVDECLNRATGQDQRIFARAAARYRDRLETNRWVDDACLAGVVGELIGSGAIAIPQSITLAGFDRPSPLVEALLSRLRARGASVKYVPLGEPADLRLHRYDSSAAELRAAGAWAREQLADSPGASIAIVAAGLEQEAEHSARLVREGFIPGWQYAEPHVARSVNVSFGRRLADYPAIHTALVALGWFPGELGSAEVSHLLRTPFLGSPERHGRARLELSLRNMPDRRWTPDLLRSALATREDAPDAHDWLERLEAAGRIIDEAPDLAAPSAWAGVMDRVLKQLNWPGEGALSSADFQLDNRWRELLNEFCRLDLVRSPIPFREAVARIVSMAAEAVFQPEAESAALDLLGPLEAGGAEFDALWITGLTATDWPPPSRPSPLISLELQREYDMPDATPAETEARASQLLRRLCASARQVVLSYPATIGDEEQLPTTLVTDLETRPGPPDPGWHALGFAGRRDVEIIDEHAPPAERGETLFGGAATINRYFSDPFAAFALGRLGVRPLAPFASGIAPPLRGTLVHAALHALYRDRPARDEIAGWSDREIAARVATAVDVAFRRDLRYADSMLANLLEIEKRRTERLLYRVIEIDRQREAFTIDSVESDMACELGGFNLTLRCDRIDREAGGSLVILDYKTGARKRFLSRGEPQDVQLVVYSIMLDDSVTGLGLFNVDSKETVIDGTGPSIGDGDDWQVRLSAWQDRVGNAVDRMAKGDVRLNALQSSDDARPLALLSRFAEVRREH